jgi:hypothetical protein
MDAERSWLRLRSAHSWRARRFSRRIDCHEGVPACSKAHRCRHATGGHIRSPGGIPAGSAPAAARCRDPMLVTLQVLIYKPSDTIGAGAG